MFKKTLTTVAALTIVSTQALCAIVDSGPLSIAVPRTTAGIYYNVVTGVSNTVPASAPGWDFNPYGSTTPSFFWPTNAVANSTGGVGAGTAYTNLAVGTVVGPASTFITTTGGGSPNFNVAGPKVIGFRLLNEGTNAVNYGYVNLDIAANLAATITRVVYENAGAAITVVTPGGGTNTITTPTSSAAAPISVGSTSAGGTPTSANIAVSAPASNTGSVSITSCTALAAPFSYTPAPTFPITIAAGASVNIPVQFAPAAGTASGPVAANFTCQTNASPASFQVFVQGTVTAPANTLNFPASSAAAPLIIGTTSAGGAPVSSNIIISAPASNTAAVLINSCSALTAPFSYTPAPTFPISVAPGASVNIPVQFAPSLATATGPQAANFTCQTNASPASFQIFAQGNVTAAIIPTIAVPSLNVWGMLAMALSLIALSFVAIRRID